MHSPISKIFIFVLFFFFSVQPLFAYEVPTHAYLTQEVIRFYNSYFLDRGISDDYARYLIDGARREDDIPRWMNHFYDPVYDRGLTHDPAIDPVINLGTWQASKDWARDPENQNGATYKVPATIASILTAIEERRLGAVSDETDFTWQEAIRAYVNGEYEKAFFSLGHVIHLIEDAAVPEHTRNDPHPGDSPYEKWAGQFTMQNEDEGLGGRLVIKEPFVFDTLEDYFKGLATYTNNNFYSKNTIGIQSGYSLPQPEYIKKEGDYFYGFLRSEDGDEFRIFLKQKQSLFNNILSNDENIVLFLEKTGGDVVLRDYWNRLSVGAVRYGAGVVNLFFREVEKAKKDPGFVREKEKSLVAQVVEVVHKGAERIIGFTQEVGNLIGVKDNDFVVEFGDGSARNIQDGLSVEIASEDDQSDSFLPADGGQNHNSNEEESVGDAGGALVSDNFEFNKQASDSNQTSFLPSLPVLPKQKASYFPGGESLPVNDGFSSGGGVSPLQGNLFIGSGGGGSSNQNESIVASGGVPLNATSSNATSSDDLAVFSTSVSNSTSSQCGFSSTAISPFVGIVRINEVAWMGSAVNSADEWIELYNTSSTERDVSGWRLLDEGGQIEVVFKDGTLIPGLGFYLLERSDDESAPRVTADSIYVGALGNTNERLKLLDGGCGVVDEISASPNWPAGDNATKKTMERVDQNSWQTSFVAGGTPKAENSKLAQEGGAVSSSTASAATSTIPSGGGGSASSSEDGVSSTSTLDFSTSTLDVSTSTEDTTTTVTLSSLISPVADFVYSPIAPVVGEFVSFDAASSRDLDGSIVSYVWDYGDTSAFAGTSSVSTHTYIKEGSYDVGLTVLDNDGASSSVQKAIVVSRVPNEGPRAGFVVLPYSPFVGQEVLFDASGSTDADGNIVSYEWNFGDGGVGVYATSTVIHVFNDAREHLVRLLIFDNEGATSSVAFAVTPRSKEADHVVISEILFDAEGSDENKEFVELYNPTDSEVLLYGWSFQSLGASADNFSKVPKKNFEEGDVIRAKGFFLIWLGDDARGDMAWKSGSLGNSGGTVLLVKNTEVVSGVDDGDIVDRVGYGTSVFAEGSSISLDGFFGGRSIERKAWSDGECVAARGDAEFSGNACDGYSNVDDFTIRDVPMPQGMGNMLESREAPSMPQLTYQLHVERAPFVSFSWGESYDAEGVTSSVAYRIQNAGEIVFEGTSTLAFDYSLEEIGRDYKFDLSAHDRDGLGSGTSSVTFEAPSYVGAAYFYPDPREGHEGGYLVEMRYDSHPFIPDPYWQLENSTWKAVVFYLNQKPRREALSTASEWKPNDLSGVLGIRYRRCTESVESVSYSLVLPDVSERCGSGDILMRTGMEYELIPKGGGLIFSIDSSSLGELPLDMGDYVTLGFYSFAHAGGGNQEFELVAKDVRKYYFSDIMPDHAAPVLQGGLSFDFSKSSSNLTISWDEATDADTLSRELLYEINFTIFGEGVLNDDNWEPLGSGQFEYIKDVLPGDAFLMGIRAKDNLGLISNVLQSTWQYPEPKWFITQTETNGWSAVFGRVQSSSFEPDSASFQNFTAEEDFSFNRVLLRAWHEEASDYTTLRLSVYSDADGVPDFANILGSASVLVFNPDRQNDISFGFGNPVSFTKDNRYWFVLDVSGYGDTRGYFRNVWRNAIMSGDVYRGGEAGKGLAQGLNEDCSLCRYSEGVGGDWYMKVGLEE